MAASECQIFRENQYCKDRVCDIKTACANGSEFIEQYYTIEIKLGDVAPLELWASALFIINVSAILLYGLLIKFEVMKKSFEPLLSTLVGNFVLVILMTISGMTSLTLEAQRPAAGFTLLFTLVAVSIVSLILYRVLVPEKQPGDLSPYQDTTEPGNTINATPISLPSSPRQSSITTVT